MDPVKVEGIAHWLTPATVKDIRSFLGFCNFYRAFIPHFSNVARPLNDLTKKNQKWEWTDTKERAFQKLKQICASYPVLCTPDWSWQFILETDALGYALGAVIMQEFNNGVHPISFNSWSLLPAKKNYNAHDKELAGMIFGFKCGQQYFLGAQHPIHVCTDHKNLQYFKEPQKIMGWQAQWMEFLQDFDYHIEHIPGTMNMITDLPSHWKDLNKGVDSNLPQILLPDTLFLRKIFLEDDKNLRRNILQQIHDSPAGGHPGIANTWELVRQHYEGPRLWDFVELYIKGCTKCQESKTNLPWRKAPLQHFDVPAGEGPFQYMSMDLITDLPRSEGFDSILTIVDQGCSKAAKFIPCNKTINGPGVAQEYLKHLVPWFGVSKCIISDWDPCFTSNFFKAICKALGVQQNLSTTFHPRTDSVRHG